MLVTECLYQKTEIAVSACLEEASRYYRKSFPFAGIRFDLKGRSAGQVRFPFAHQQSSESFPLLRFNASLLMDYGDHFIQEVVPHECAHIVVYHLYRPSRYFKKQGPKPHGLEWQSVMREVFKMEPRVTHNFVVASSPSKVYFYRCACDDKQHKVSLIRHNKVKRGVARYLCKRCGVQLVESGVQLSASESN